MEALSRSLLGGLSAFGLALVGLVMDSAVRHLLWPGNNGIEGARLLISTISIFLEPSQRSGSTF